jgi:hypothetical protein
MPNIGSEFSGQTVITTFEVTPGTCQDLIDELTLAYAEVISKCPGFIGSALHLNDAQTRVANYSQWRGRADFIAPNCGRRGTDGMSGVMEARP